MSLEYRIAEVSGELILQQQRTTRRGEAIWSSQFYFSDFGDDEEVARAIGAAITHHFAKKALGKG